MQVVRSGISAGNLVKDWFDIPAGTPVSAAMGDLQCSVKSTLGISIRTSYTIRITNIMFS